MNLASERSVYSLRSGHILHSHILKVWVLVHKNNSTDVPTCFSLARFCSSHSLRRWTSAKLEESMAACFSRNEMMRSKIIRSRVSSGCRQKKRFSSHTTISNHLSNPYTFNYRVNLIFGTCTCSLGTYTGLYSISQTVIVTVMELVQSISLCFTTLLYLYIHVRVTIILLNPMSGSSPSKTVHMFPQYTVTYSNIHTW